MTIYTPLRAATAGLGLLGLGLMSGTAIADFVHNDDVIVDGSLCVGFDCVNGESFGFDTIRLKENNLRIRFQDTSAAASFPTNDWQIIINDSANGGSSYFAIQDASSGRQIFRLAAGAPANSIRVRSNGNVGIGTGNPVTELHITDGDTSVVRLEQDGSSGFAPQTWDVAGNETNFFIRDVTNGSKLPFRIRPSAPTSSIDIAADGDVGIGTASPSSALHVRRTAAGSTDMLKLTSNGGGFITLENTAASGSWFMTHENNNPNRFLISHSVGGVQMALTQTGDLTISGGLVTTGGGGACTLADPCDLVFDPEVYKVPSIEDHAKEMWANKYLPAVGPTKAGEPINVTVKMMRMLNELEKAHIYIEQLNEQNTALEKEVSYLKTLELRIADLERGTQ